MHLIIVLIALISTIVIHELGHYLAAKLFKTGIQSFSVGFGRPAITWKNRYGTQWRLTPWIFGGYVSMLQEPSQTIIGIPYPKQQAWKRGFIIFAGPLMNLIFASLLFSFALILNLEHPKAIVGHVQENSLAEKAQIKANDYLLRVGSSPTQTWPNTAQALILQLGNPSSIPLLIQRQDKRIEVFLDLAQWTLDPLKPELLQSLGITPLREKSPPIISSVLSGSAAEAAQLQVGDHITAVKLAKSREWIAITDGYELVEWIKTHPKQVITIRLKREQEFLEREITLRTKGWPNQKGSLGITVKKPMLNPLFRQSINLDNQPLVIASFKQIIQTLSFQGQTIAMLLSGKLSPMLLGGPASLVKFSVLALKQGIAQFFYFLAIINCMIALINLIPLPLLDGGQLLLLGMETLSGKKISGRYRQLIDHIGIILLSLLMMQAIINDGLRFFSS